MTEQRTTLGAPLPIVHGEGPEFLEVTLPESVCERELTICATPNPAQPSPRMKYKNPKPKSNVATAG